MTPSIAIRAVDIPMPKRLPSGTRTAVEAAIELHQHALTGLIAVLDLFDGDTDLEPSLGEQIRFRSTAAVDLEADPADDEPSLGSLNCIGAIVDFAIDRRGFSQTAWAAGGTADMEAQHDGREVLTVDDAG